jgi:predicted DNA-binding transcriptional regulator
MAEATTRDEVWIVALNIALRKEVALRPDDLAETVGCSERTARDCLNVMSRAGFLNRDVKKDGTVRFRPPSEFSN